VSSYERLISHLPSLYRPEVNEENLFNLLLKELGITLDALGRDLTLVMQAHWCKTADKAAYDPHFLRGRELAGEPPAKRHDPKDQRLIAEYPYLLDLARLGALLSISPWREPVALRETVEQYRLRLLRIMQIYRNGLGTLPALRDMVTAELPENLHLPLPARKRSFSVEENSPFIGPFKNVQSLGLPVNEIGPLMRWQLSNTGTQRVAPIVYIEGIAATAERDATVRPMVERFNPTGLLPDEGGLAAVGVGYLGTLAADDVLKLQPGYSACLCGDGGVFMSAVQEKQFGIKGWHSLAGAPAGRVSALLQTSDKMLWLATEDGGTQELWRYNGSSWLQVLPGETLPPIHCLQQRQQQLLIGHAEGLAVVDLYPAGTGDYVRSEIAAYSGQAVFCCRPRHNMASHFYIGSSDGLTVLDESDSIGQTFLTGTAIHAVAESATGVYCGGDLGLMLYQHQGRQFYYLSAEFESEMADDWLPFETGNLPSGINFGLPPVRALLVEYDGSLWIGTEQGLARYRARHEKDLVYRNLLEAFVDLIDGSVTNMQRDEHGYLWFTTNRGLLRYDGRDLARFNLAEEVWQQLGQADLRYLNEQVGARGVWRYQRTPGGWQVFDYAMKQWAAFATLPDLPVEPFTNLVFIDRVVATLGSLDGQAFVPRTDVDSSLLVLRCKPDHTRIVEGGIAALPRIPKGDSTWRYVSVEAQGLVDGTDLPWWSVEGRLVPPPDHHAPYPGRFHDLPQLPLQLDQMVFAYNPAARIKLQWTDKKPLQVLVRLLQRNSNDVIDPAIIDRVWRGINQVRPAGVQLFLAVEGDIVRGEIT
jgi:hypothetical protein